jgi:hypothetical protein
MTETKVETYYERTIRELVEQGYQRNWGDAAVMLPDLEILRKETKSDEDDRVIAVDYAVVSTLLSRPVIINADLMTYSSPPKKSWISSWGIY